MTPSGWQQNEAINHETLDRARLFSMPEAKPEAKEDTGSAVEIRANRVIGSLLAG
jgi:hypothetical protein